MQLSERVKDNQSHISIAMQVEFVTMGGRTMLQPVINMVRYDGFNSYLFLCFYSITAVLSEITIMLFCSLCHTQFSSRFALKRHQNTKHNETFSGYTCIHCNKTVTTKYSLKKTYTYMQIKRTIYSKS